MTSLRVGFEVIENLEHLDQRQERLDAALLCALDCEWEPGAARPAASLASVSVWSPDYGIDILLLDLLALGDAARAVLKQLLRRPTCLKVGFGLATDLRALGLAVAEPYVDLAGLHTYLAQAQAPGINAAWGRGLGAVCEAQLGRSLDKSLQTSAWGERPLSQEQLQYAALDSACLIQLLDQYLINLNPADWPHGSSGTASTSSIILAAAQQKPSSTDGGGSRDAGSTRAASREAQAAVGAASLAVSLEPKQLQQAAVHWGWRLDVNEMPVPKQASRKGKKVQVELAALPGGGFPLHVPWMKGKQGQPAAFICDVMAQATATDAAGLARQLRLLGIDAEDVATVPKTQRHAVHRMLVERAEEEGRVILTSDKLFCRRNLSDQAYLVRSTTKHKQVDEVLLAFSLKVEEDDLLSRCPRCNGLFVPEALPASRLPPGHGVPKSVLDRHGSEDAPGFWVCSRCQQPYWEGSQFRRAMERLTGLVTG